MMTPKILIVEDEAAIVTLLRYNLEREGFEVLEASDGEEAMLMAIEKIPDLILRLDVTASLRCRGLPQIEPNA